MYLIYVYAHIFKSLAASQKLLHVDAFANSLMHMKTNTNTSASACTCLCACVRAKVSTTGCTRKRIVGQQESEVSSRYCPKQQVKTVYKVGSKPQLANLDYN